MVFCQFERSQNREVLLTEDFQPEIEKNHGS
jgi:hypothetical protein